MSDQPASPDTPPAVEEPCEDCSPVTGRAVFLAVAFAAFAAWVAADFATGGKLTGWAVATLAALRGRGGDGER